MTKKQLEVYNNIKNFIKENSYPPTVRELCKLIGIKSSSSVQAHLYKLKNKGFITWEEGKTRTLKIIKEVEM